MASPSYQVLLNVFQYVEDLNFYGETRRFCLGWPEIDSQLIDCRKSSTTPNSTLMMPQPAMFVKASMETVGFCLPCARWAIKRV